MPDTKGHLLPVYVVADESASMRPHAAELKAGLDALYSELRMNPMVAAKVRLAVLGFSDSVAVRLPLCDVREQPTMPPMGSGNTTSFAAVFSDLLNRIPADVTELKRQTYLVHRPAVFFLSDGQPNRGEDWRGPLAKLTDHGATLGAPNIIACGIGDADAATIGAVATAETFGLIAVPGADIGRAIAGFFGALTNSVIHSGQTLAAGSPELVIDRPDQFVLTIDMV